MSKRAEKWPVMLADDEIIRRGLGLVTGRVGVWYCLPTKLKKK